MTSYPFSFAAPVESAEQYQEGGYHPIKIGYTFNNRYRVINKLGRGANSTIWLVEDNHQKCLASLKVLSADASKYSSEMKMSQVLQNAQNRPNDHPGKAHVVTVIDTFVHEGPNGVHDCIVTEVLGPNLASRLPSDYYGPFNESHPPQVTTKIATQVALGVAYLHSCGIVHGNLRLGHVLFYSSKLHNPSPDEQLHIYGEVSTYPIQYLCGPPERAWDHPSEVINVPELKGVLDACLTPPEAVHIKIIDLGHSSLYNPRPESIKPPDLQIPIIYRAPEVIFNDVKSPNFPADVWALGVMLYAIMNNNYPPFRDEPPDELDSVLSCMLLRIGRLPPRWAKKWTGLSDFDEESLDKAPIWPFQTYTHIPEEEYQPFEKIMRDTFRYNPEETIRADNVARRVVSWEKKIRRAILDVRIPPDPIAQYLASCEDPEIQDPDMISF